MLVFDIANCFIAKFSVIVLSICIGVAICYWPFGFAGFKELGMIQYISQLMGYANRPSSNSPSTKDLPPKPSVSISRPGLESENPTF